MVGTQTFQLEYEYEEKEEEEVQGKIKIMTRIRIRIRIKTRGRTTRKMMILTISPPLLGPWPTSSGWFGPSDG